MSTPTRLHVRPLTWLLVALAVVFVALAIVYFTTAASQLPSFMPGHEAHVSRHHTKHGLAMLGLAALTLIGAWFSTAPSPAAP